MACFKDSDLPPMVNAVPVVLAGDGSQVEPCCKGGDLPLWARALL